MNEFDYKPRIIDSLVERYLTLFGAVCIEGAKWCGKTSTARHHSKSVIYLGDPSGNFQNKALAEMTPDLVLQGEQPRLIDEWQEVPRLWDAVRHQVDQTGKKGQYLLTGSATPTTKGVLHSGAGRIKTIKMRPMSLSESGDSENVVSLEKLFKGEFTSAIINQPTLKQLIHLVVRGGWPGSLGMNLEDAIEVTKAYIDAVINHDLYRIEGIQRDTRKMEKLLRALARHESTTVSINTLRKDILESDNETIDSNTIADYLNVFQRLFLIDDQPAYSENLRSNVRQKQAVKRHLVDPSLACALLNISAQQLEQDLNYFGFLFESLVQRDLRIYAEANGGKLYHYQDYKNKEIDAVIEMPDGEIGAFEIKLGANQIDQAAEGLLKIAADIKKDGGKVPKILVVVCGLANAAYQRPDGVYVVPITGLGR